MFPITVLIVATGILFDPIVALAHALGGSLLGAGATFQLGRLVGGDLLRNMLGRRVNRVRRAVVRQGVLSVALLRMVPVAPFSLINMVAGASRIRFWDFILGTLIGMTPGILVITLLGNQLSEVLTSPDPRHFLWLGACLLAWLVLSLGMQQVARRLRKRNV